MLIVYEPSLPAIRAIETFRAERGVLPQVHLLCYEKSLESFRFEAGPTMSVRGGGRTFLST